MSEIKKITNIITPNGEDLQLTDSEAVHKNYGLIEENELGIIKNLIVLDSEDDDISSFDITKTLLNTDKYKPHNANYYSRFIDNEIDTEKIFINNTQYRGYIQCKNILTTGRYVVIAKIKFLKYNSNILNIGCLKTIKTQSGESEEFAAEPKSVEEIFEGEIIELNKIYDIGYCVSITCDNINEPQAGDTIGLGIGFKNSNIDQSIEVQVVDFKIYLTYTTSKLSDINFYFNLPSEQQYYSKGGNTIVYLKNPFINNKVNCCFRPTSSSYMYFFGNPNQGSTFAYKELNSTNTEYLNNGLYTFGDNYEITVRNISNKNSHSYFFTSEGLIGAVSDPEDPTDVANKRYVDSSISNSFLVDGDLTKLKYELYDEYCSVSKDTYGSAQSQYSKFYLPCCYLTCNIKNDGDNAAIRIDNNKTYNIEPNETITLTNELINKYFELKVDMGNLIFTNFTLKFDPYYYSTLEQRITTLEQQLIVQSNS